MLDMVEYARTATMRDEDIVALMTDPARREEGFRLLIERYQERLYHHVRRLVWEHEDANDVLQNCFIKVFRKIDGFRGQSRLYTWLYRIATNEALSLLEKRKRQAVASLDDEEQSAAQLSADVYFDGNEAQLRLQTALSRLPPKQRLVFNLRYFDGMSYEEMSEILRTSVGALKASYHHAVRKIEQFITG